MLLSWIVAALLSSLVTSDSINGVGLDNDLTFYDQDGGVGTVGGIVNWNGAVSETNIVAYNLYFGSSKTTKLSLIASVPSSQLSTYTYSIVDGTSIPTNANYILAYSYSGTIENLINSRVYSCLFSDAHDSGTLNYGANIYLSINYDYPGDNDGVNLNPRQRILGSQNDGLNVFTNDLGSSTQSLEYASRAQRYLWRVRSSQSSGLANIEIEPLASQCITYGSIVLFQLNANAIYGSGSETPLWLNGGNSGLFGSYMEVNVGNIANTQYITNYEWIIRSFAVSSRSQADPLASQCVKMGDNVYLQNMLIDDRYLVGSLPGRVSTNTNNGQSTETLNIGLVNQLTYQWRPLSSDTYEAPSNFHYNTNSLVLTKNRQMSTLVALYNKSPVNFFSVSPSLPNGLTLNPVTGWISGMPLISTASIIYAVKAFSTSYCDNNCSPSIFLLTIDVNGPPSNIYQQSSVVYTIHVPIIPLLPTYQSGLATTNVITPSLPNGLTMDSSTGIISGTPLVLSSATLYTIIATNSYAWTEIALTIQVSDAQPLNFNYPKVNYNFQIGISLDLLLIPTNQGGFLKSYSVSPTLPSGLEMSPSSGVIYGTPLGPVTGRKLYTITGYSLGGSISTVISIEIVNGRISKSFAIPASAKQVASTFRERLALIDLYNNAGGDNWQVQWDVSSCPCRNNWYGITCNPQGSIIGVNLQNNRLSGILVDSIGNLNRIQTLNLADNDLTGEVPSSVANMINLRMINLSSNQFTGPLPVALATFQYLDVVLFQNNRGFSYQEVLLNVNDSPDILNNRKLADYPWNVVGPVQTGAENVVCAAGTYAALGAMTCVSCPISSYCLASSTEPIFCNNGYTTISTGQTTAASCVLCPAGSACGGLGSVILCNSGQYSLAGQTVCSNCLAGYYCLPNTETGCAKPTPCPAGFYSNVLSATSSSVCASCITNPNYGSGWWSLPGSIECFGVTCEQSLGYSGSPSECQCLAGYSGTVYYTNGQPMGCSLCPVNTWSSDGASSCTNCEQGFISAAGSTTACTVICPTGFYCNSGLQIPCPSGTYSTSAGAFSAQTCQTCAAGTTSTSGNGQACLPCSAGSYSNYGDPSCSLCAAGYYSAAIGASNSNTCILCPPGYWTSAGSAVCINSCGGGYFCLNGVRSPCPSSTYSTANYATTIATCISCSGGSSSLAGSTTCVQCQAGTAAVAGGPCVPCLAGFYSASGSQLCSQCGAGSYSLASQATCTLCNVGTFSAALGATSIATCQSCTTQVGAGYWSTLGSSSCYAVSCFTTGYTDSSYLGCFVDTITRDLSTFLGSNSNGQLITIELCRSLASANGLMYFGVQGGSTCWGGNTYGRWGNSLSCNINCISNSNENCGGILANAIYTVAPATAAGECTCDEGYSGVVSYNFGIPSGCTICQAGYYSGINSLNCSPCPSGTASATVGAVSSATCHNCAAGYWSASGSSTCLPINCLSAGYYGVGGACTCAAGYSGTVVYVNGFPTGCTICPPGSYSANNAASCTNCNAGYFSANAGAVSASACLNCQTQFGLGFWSVAGSSTCLGVSCGGVGYYGVAGGCVCAAGYSGIVNYGSGQATGCSQCGVGTWSANGATYCVPCVPGYYSTTIGAQSIATCSSCTTNFGAGMWSNAGGSSCFAVSCAVTGYTGTSGSCVCDVGYYGSVSYSGGAPVGCSSCVAGTYSTSIGSATCAQCAAGTYSLIAAASSSSSCQNCPGGYWSNAASGNSLASYFGSINNNKYIPNFAGGGTIYSTLAMAMQGCITYSSTCLGITGDPSGYFTIRQGPGLITSTNGEFSYLMTSVPCTINCGIGYYCGGGLKTACPAGYYSAATNAIALSACNSCPSGYYSASAASSCISCSTTFGLGYWSPAASSTCALCTGSAVSSYNIIGYSLTSGSSLAACQGIISPDNSHMFVLGGDGNAVLYNINTGSILWSTSTAGAGTAPYSVLFNNAALNLNGNGVTLFTASMGSYTCAQEGATCTCTGTVKYGKNASWVSLTSSGSLSCAMQTFGSDPAPGVSKICTCLSTTGYTLTATSGGNLVVTAPDGLSIVYQTSTSG